MPAARPVAGFGPIALDRAAWHDIGHDGFAASQAESARAEMISGLLFLAED
jgi:hypothetical protein